VDVPPIHGGNLRHRLLLAASTLCVVALLAVVVGTLGGWFDPDPAAGEVTAVFQGPTSTTTSTQAAAPPAPTVPASVDLATPHGEVPAYDRPNGQVIGTAGEWYGYSMTMPVVKAGFGWVQVMMPERPNGSTAWVKASDVDMSSTDYRIVVTRSQTHAVVYKAGQPVFDFAIGMGKASTPTPLGSFFVAVVEHDVGHGYGPIVLDLNAHSEAIQSWQGAGDAIIAFHGPFGAQATIAKGGGYVSNGCMRMLPADQAKLGVIPVGTPVDIVE
jgi:lipoprotein-anchoring transpeptidase ErfK/SrfK